jgi:hypothetical protein
LKLDTAFENTGARLTNRRFTLSDLQKSADGDARTRCVLLAAGGEQPPDRLLVLLDQPDTHTVSVAHPLLAAAELAALERERRIAETQGLGTKDQNVLVVVNRESWRDLSALFKSVRIHMPAVSIWVCTDRVAIEVYAGTGKANEPEDLSPRIDQPTVEENDFIDDGTNSGEVGEEELRFLLKLYEADSSELEDEDEQEGQ